MPSIGEMLELKRADLLSFPKETVDLILEMQKDGWRGHRNAQGHVKMLAPDGETYVMATQNPNSPKYVRSGYRQYKQKHKQEEVNSTLPKTTQKWPCARHYCPKVYASEEQLNRHIAVDHENKLMCEYTNCFEVRDTKQKLSLHMTSAHGYVSPRKAQRKKQEANRKKREEMGAIDGNVTTVDDIAFTEEQTKVAEQYLKDPTGVEFDPEMVEKFTKVGVKVPDDVMVIEPMTERQRAFKDLAATAQIPEVDRSFVSAAERDERVNWSIDPKGIDVENLQGSVQSSGVVRTDEPDRKGDDYIAFIDDRDSWVIDRYDITDRRIGTLEQILDAAGLRMEIRVWKPSKD